MFFDHLTVEEQLSQSTIFAIAQDKKGFIWIATRDGLNRNDSHEIKTYRNNPETDNFIRIVNNPANRSSLSNNSIHIIFEDNEKNVWVETRNGLNILVSGDTARIIQFYNFPNKPKSLVVNVD